VPQSAADSQEGAGKNSTDRAGSIVPEKGEPHGVSVTSQFADRTVVTGLVTLFKGQNLDEVNLCNLIVCEVEQTV
jgi:hypothetical protein